MILRAILANLAFVSAAAAEPAGTRLSYAAYNNGFNVIDVTAEIALEPARYHMQVSYRLTGVVGALVHGDSVTVVDGRFEGGKAEPRELFSTGHLRGQARVTQIDWQSGNPVISQLVPPIETEREPVPPQEQLHTIDTLSALAMLMHEVTETGRCEGGANTFDGRRLSVIEVRTVGEEVLEPTSRSTFHGAALRCDFDGRQVAGFVKDEDREALSRPQHGSAWFARTAPGEPVVPVRMQFETRLFGPATMYLTAESP